MRRAVAATLGAAAIAMATLASASAGAQTAVDATAAQTATDQKLAQSYDAQTTVAPPADDTVIRTMYVTMGAMTGYMFAVMPVTMSAITAAAASGAAAMWVYDTMYAPANTGR